MVLQNYGMTKREKGADAERKKLSVLYSKQTLATSYSAG